MKQTPMYQAYARVAPRPADWPVLHTKLAEISRRQYDWSREVAAIHTPTLLVFGDADAIRTAQAVAICELLGGDGGWDGSGISNARLAILPGLTHYTIFSSPALVAAVAPFLDAPAPKEMYVSREGRLVRHCGGSVEHMQSQAMLPPDDAMGKDGIFDEGVAANYDQENAARFAPDVLGPTVELLAELANGGPALELAIGTGRVALPLAAKGVDVHGIDMSKPMVARLRAKPGGSQIPVTIGNMATTRLGCTFSLVYLVFNTITNLLTQDEQVSCFANAAAHLSSGGVFLIEVELPNLHRLPPGERFVVSEMSDRDVCVDEYDVAAQRLTSHHYQLAGRRCEIFRSSHRYAWPAEYDLMARLAGLTLRHRWANWQREPFCSTSTAHVSVWAKNP